jgi:hypothetical protein
MSLALLVAVVETGHAVDFLEDLIVIHHHLKYTSAVLAVLSFTLASCAGGSGSVPVAAGAASVAGVASGVSPQGVRRSPHCTSPINVSESFSPNRLRIGYQTFLTVTLSNVCSSSNLWKFTFSDTLPVGLLGAIFVSSTCGVGTYPYSVLYGGTFYAYSAEDLPMPSSCSMTWMIESHAVGTWTNSIPANAAGQPSNAVSTSVTYTVAAPTTSPGPIHTP